MTLYVSYSREKECFREETGQPLVQIRNKDGTLVNVKDFTVRVAKWSVTILLIRFSQINIGEATISHRYSLCLVSFLLPHPHSVINPLIFLFHIII